MNIEPDDLAVEAMVAVFTRAYGPLPSELRDTVAAIIGASTELGMEDPDAWREAEATLRSYLTVTTCACKNGFCPLH